MSFQDKLKPVQTPAPAGGGFQQKLKALGSKSTFNVPEPANYRENRIKQFQAEADVSNQEAADANSFWGKTKAFGKGLVQSIAPSESNLGRTLGALLYQGGKADKGLQEVASQGEDVKVNLIKTIREEEAKGNDTTRLKQAYNEQEKNVATINRTAKDLVQLPSTAKVAGQIGGTALDLATAGTYSKAKTGAMSTGRLFTQTPAVKAAAVAVGAPELAAVANQTARGLFSLRGAGNIGVGAGTGYASDVALGLQGERGEEREGARAFIPGLGTLLGATLPTVAETAQTVRNVSDPVPSIVEKRMRGLVDLETKNGKVAKVFDAADRKGIDVRKTLAETNLLNGAIDPDGRISSDKALNNFNEFIQPYEGRVKEALNSENRSVQLNQLVTEAKNFINKSSLSDRQKVELQQEIAGQLDAFSQFRGKSVPVTALHDTKVVLANSNNYLNPSKNIVDKEAARFFKELVERNTSSMDVAKYNGELSKFYTVREALEAMDRAVVSGGRMGKYFSSLIGSGVGGLTAGPLGAIAGAEAGAKARGSQMSRLFGGNINKGLEATPEMTEALKPVATGRAAIPDVVMGRNTPAVPDVNIPSFKTGETPATIKKTGSIPVGKMPTSIIGATKKTFEGADNLKPDYKKVETKAFEKIAKEEDKLIDEYISKNGKVINTDNFRPLFKDVGYNGSNAAAVQEPSSYLSKKAFSRLLAENLEKYVTFLAGGSGSGKTSAIKNLPAIAKVNQKSAAILDSNLSSYSSAIKRIEETQKAGKKVRIEYVYRDPIESFEQGVVTRMLNNPDEMGRLVPSSVVAGNHIDSFNVVRRLQDEGHRVVFIDNSLGQGKAKLIKREDLEKKVNLPSREELTEKFNSIAKKLYDDGKITREQYQGYTE